MSGFLVDDGRRADEAREVALVASPGLAERGRRPKNPELVAASPPRNLRDGAPVRGGAASASASARRAARRRVHAGWASRLRARAAVFAADRRRRERRRAERRTRDASGARVSNGSGSRRRGGGPPFCVALLSCSGFERGGAGVNHANRRARRRAGVRRAEQGALEPSRLGVAARPAPRRRARAPRRPPPRPRARRGAAGPTPQPPWPARRASAARAARLQLPSQARGVSGPRALGAATLRARCRRRPAPSARTSAGSLWVVCARVLGVIAFRPRRS